MMTSRHSGYPQGMWSASRREAAIMAEIDTVWRVVVRHGQGQSAGWWALGPL
jgi:hypothetical protein